MPKIASKLEPTYDGPVADASQIAETPDRKFLTALEREKLQTVGEETGELVAQLALLETLIVPPEVLSLDGTYSTMISLHPINTELISFILEGSGMTFYIGGKLATQEQLDELSLKLRNLGFAQESQGLVLGVETALPGIARLELNGEGTIRINVMQRNGTERVVPEYTVNGSRPEFPFGPDDVSVTLVGATGTARAQVV